MRRARAAAAAYSGEEVSSPAMLLSMEERRRGSGGLLLLFHIEVRVGLRYNEGGMRCNEAGIESGQCSDCNTGLNQHGQSDLLLGVNNRALQKRPERLNFQCLC